MVMSIAVQLFRYYTKYMEKEALKNDKGVFTLSIDYEFAWGYSDYDFTIEDKVRIRKEIEIVGRLIDLFEKYSVPVTWAIVGHLLEKDCSWENAVPHPEYTRLLSMDGKRGWFDGHPPRGEVTDTLWFRKTY